LATKEIHHVLNLKNLADETDRTLERCISELKGLIALIEKRRLIQSLPSFAK